jgi:hypothetical protein
MAPGEINTVLRGHYTYYGVAGNLRSLAKVYRAVERYWRRMLCSRSWAGGRLTRDAFNQIKERTPLLKPKLRLPYGKLQARVNRRPKNDPTQSNDVSDLSCRSASDPRADSHSGP